MSYTEFDNLNERELLSLILKELILLNERIEHGFETDIQHEDIEDNDYGC